MTDKAEMGANRIVLLLCLGVALFASYRLIQPFLQPIVLAILVGMLAQPVHVRILRAMKGREAAAALISCLALCMLILVPMLGLFVAVLDQGISYSLAAKSWAASDGVQTLLARPWVVQIQSGLVAILPEGTLEAENIRSRALALASSMGGTFASVSSKMVGSVTGFFLNFVLLLFVLFFVLKDHARLLAFLRRALPLSRSQEDILYREVREVSKSALLGSLLTAVTQGIAGGIALWIVGIPGLFWGTIMAFTSLIPFVGTAIIWVPAAIYLAVSGDIGWAIFMVAWGALVIGSIDNFLRPLFMQGASMNTVVVFFSLLGGLQVFGLMGLVYGPLIFSIALVLFKLYEEEFSSFLNSQDRS